jgi:UTP--glucose-1-phosphate uridylyltransferase
MAQRPRRLTRFLDFLLKDRRSPSMVKPIRKAIFPVAGLGTRFLPATKAIPKEMLPILNKPLIQYAVDEAMEAGIESFIFIVSEGRDAIKEHFAPAPELEKALEEQGKTELLALIRDVVLKPGQATYINQDQPLGLGHAIWCAREELDLTNEAIAVILPDDLILNQNGAGCLKQMIDVYGKMGGNIAAVENVPKEKTNRYGILDVVNDDGVLAKAKGLVEKPDPADAPSTLSIIGRYILQPEIFAFLEKKERGAGNEIQLTDAMAKTIDDIPFHGFRFKGKRFDCGNQKGFVEANSAFAKAFPE